jgi:hypothetical protein
LCTFSCASQHLPSWGCACCRVNALPYASGTPARAVLSSCKHHCAHAAGRGVAAAAQSASPRAQAAAALVARRWPDASAERTANLWRWRSVVCCRAALRPSVSAPRTAHRKALWLGTGGGGAVPVSHATMYELLLRALGTFIRLVKHTLEVIRPQTQCRASCGSYRLLSRVHSLGSAQTGPRTDPVRAASLPPAGASLRVRRAASAQRAAGRARVSTLFHTARGGAT